MNTRDNNSPPHAEEIPSTETFLHRIKAPIEEPARRRRWLQWLGTIISLFIIVTASLVIIFFFTLPDIAALQKENPKLTIMMRYREAQYQDKGRKLRRLQYWAPLSRISHLLINAVLISEDDKFFQHEGFDWESMKQAFEKNIDRKKVVMGGSTITQQLAKNLFLKPTRTPWRKLREAVIAHNLEKELDKRRILELYLNVIEWGDGIYGIEAAAKVYYQKSAAELTASESIRLASILVNPHRYSPLANINKRMRNKRLLLAERMFKRKLYDETTWQTLVTEFTQ